MLDVVLLVRSHKKGRDFYKRCLAVIGRLHTWLDVYHLQGSSLMWSGSLYIYIYLFNNNNI